MLTAHVHRRRRTARDLLPVLALVALAVVTRLPSFGASVIDWDESVYVLVAEGWRAGHLPYTGIWDNKPIGIYAVLAGFQAVFGDNIAALRLAGLAATIATALLIRAVTRRLIGRDAGAAWSATLAGALFVLASIPDDGLASNTELFMVAFTSLAMFTALSGTGMARAVAAGAALGVACMMKYVAVFEAPVVFLALLAAPPAAGRVVRLGVAYAAGVAAPFCLTLAFYWMASAWPAFLRVSLLSYVARAGAPFSAAALVTAYAQQLWLSFPLLLCPLVLLVFAVGAPRRAALLLAWIIAAAVGVSVGGFFYSHYFLQILPPLCVAAGFLIARIILRLGNRDSPLSLRAQAKQSSRERGAGALDCFAPLAMTGHKFSPRSFGITPRGAAAPVLAAAMLAVPVLRAWQVLLPMLPYPALPAAWVKSLVTPHDTPARIAAVIRPELRAQPGATLYVFDAEPIIYSLAGAVPPTRFAFPSYLLSTLLARVAGVDAPAEVARIMRTGPLFVVRAVPRHAGFAGGTNADAVRVLDAALADHYTPWRSFAGAEVFRRR